MGPLVCEHDTHLRVLLGETYVGVPRFNVSHPELSLLYTVRCLLHHLTDIYVRWKYYNIGNVPSNVSSCGILHGSDIHNYIATVRLCRSHFGGLTYTAGYCMQ